MGHGAEVGGHLDPDVTRHRLPVEEASFDLGNRDGSGVVVGLLALVLGAVVPRRSPGVGVPDQGVGVEVFKGFSGHVVLLLEMTKAPSGCRRLGVCRLRLFSCQASSLHP